MSRSNKRQETRNFRSPKGRKFAKAHGLRTVPPGQNDDIKPDNQCHKIGRIIKKLFNKGVQIEEIEKKVKAKYGVPHWQWLEMTEFDFDSYINIHFGDMIAMNEDETELISISTPGVEPCFMVDIDYLPIEDYLIIKENRLLRYRSPSPTIHHWMRHHTVPHEEPHTIYEFPNPKLTKLLVHIRNHYVETGMLMWYAVKKWQMGLEKCTIECLEYEE